MLLEYYDSLNRLLDSLNLEFKEKSICVNSFIMAKNNNEDIWYICHYQKTVDGYFFDSVRAYDNKEKPSGIMIKMIARGM